MRWVMKDDSRHIRLRAICKGSGCVIAVALIAFMAVGPAMSGVVSVSPGEASISPSGSGNSVPLGALAGFVGLLAGGRTAKADRQICTEAPRFAGAMASTEVVRPGRGKAASVEVKGAISLADGCALRKLTYSVEDEHARFDGAAEARLADDGSFSIEVPLQRITMNDSSRQQSKQYTITLFAEDEAGVGRSEAIDVMVISSPRIH